MILAASRFPRKMSAPDSATPLQLGHYDRMELPHQTVVLSNGADPPEDDPIDVHRHSANSIPAEGVDDFLHRFCHRGPCALGGESGVEKSRSRFDPWSIRPLEILDREMHLDVGSWRLAFQPKWFGARMATSGRSSIGPGFFSWAFPDRVVEL
jgi:hypothetical protein